LERPKGDRKLTTDGREREREKERRGEGKRERGVVGTA
jgi:hypothetical protein